MGLYPPAANTDDINTKDCFHFKVGFCICTREREGALSAFSFFMGRSLFLSGSSSAHNKAGSPLRGTRLTIVEISVSQAI